MTCQEATTTAGAVTAGPGAGRRGWRLADWVVLVFLFAAWSRPHVVPHLINDEAVEMLQAQDLPPGLHYLAPTHAAGLVDTIEAVGPYLNRALWSVFGLGTGPLQVFHALLLALAVALLASASAAAHGARGGAAAALVAGASAYAIF
jgi:hypothetical protein